MGAGGKRGRHTSGGRVGRSPHFLLIRLRRGLGREEGRRAGGGGHSLARRGRTRGRPGHRASSASSPEPRAPLAAASPALRASVRPSAPPRGTMPAVDKLLLEEALQDSPQVPPAARVPLARGLEALPAPGWRLGVRRAPSGAKMGRARPYVLSPGCSGSRHPSGRAGDAGKAPRGRSLCVPTPFQTQLKPRLLGLRLGSTKCPGQIIFFCLSFVVR